MENPTSSYSLYISEHLPKRQAPSGYPLTASRAMYGVRAASHRRHLGCQSGQAFRPCRSLKLLVTKKSKHELQAYGFPGNSSISKTRPADSDESLLSSSSSLSSSSLSSSSSSFVSSSSLLCSASSSFASSTFSSCCGHGTSCERDRDRVLLYCLILLLLLQPPPPPASLSSRACCRALLRLCRCWSW